MCLLWWSRYYFKGKNHYEEGFCDIFAPFFVHGPPISCDVDQLVSGLMTRKTNVMLTTYCVYDKESWNFILLWREIRKEKNKKMIWKRTRREEDKILIYWGHEIWFIDTWSVSMFVNDGTIDLMWSRNSIAVAREMADVKESNNEESTLVLR